MSTGRRTARGRAALILMALAGVLLPPATAHATSCLDDPPNDTFLRSEAGAEPVAQNEPAADIVRFCAELRGDLLVLTAHMQQALDPLEDPHWRSQQTRLRWTVRVERDDGTLTYEVREWLDDGALRAVVERDGERVCQATARFTEDRHEVEFPSSCVGSPTRVVLAADIMYDADPDDFDSAVFVDDGVGGNRESVRLSGTSRIGTSVAVAIYGFRETADAVYLARADVFADAVAAGTLTDGPILLVPQCADAVPESIAAQIERLDPRVVVALGGPHAVCEELLASAAGERERARLSGAGRIETAVAIAHRAFPVNAEEVYLAGAAVFADAVAGGMLTRGPILLVPSQGPVPAVVHEEIARLDPERVVALGGTNAVSAEVLDAAAGTREQDRISGPTRVATAVAIARYQFPERATEVYLARSDNVADAVVAGTLTKGPILLVPSDAPLPEIVAAEIARLQPWRVVALGGEHAVSESVLREATSAGR